MDKKHSINHEIRGSTVMLVEEGVAPHVISLREALMRAEEQDKDLVQISVREDNVPVCKIIDYNRMLYQESKKKHQQDLKNKVLPVKSLVFRPATGTNDFNLKVKHANEFLVKGHKVKIIIKFRNRESTMKDINQQLIDSILNNVAENGELDSKLSYSFKEANFLIKPSKV